MKKIEINKEEIDETISFLKNKEKIINMINSFMDEYENFTKSVAPKNWRFTGHHFSELRRMKEEIHFFSEITKKDKENEWVKEQVK